MQVQGMEFTLSIMSVGVTTLDYPIRKEDSDVQLVFSGAGLFSIILYAT